MDEQLLIRFLNHQCSVIDLKQIDEWIATDKANADWLFEMERIWSLKDEMRFSDSHIINEAYVRFLTRLEKNESSREKVGNRKKKFFLSSLKYAAAIIIVALLSLNLYQIQKKQISGMNTIEVPMGQRVSLTLSDNTRVWLNAQSKFTYPSDFSDENRIVDLDGEGYFEVSHDEDAPFIVHSESVYIKVLGTKFNVKSYYGEDATVSLEEGSVKVATHDEGKEITLKPKEEAVYSRQTETLLVRNADMYATRSWIYGEFVFTRQRLDYIIKELERRFEVQITINDKELAADLFTCRVRQETTLEQILELLKSTRRLDYKIKGREVFIFKKDSL